MNRIWLLLLPLLATAAHAATTRQTATQPATAQSPKEQLDQHKRDQQREHLDQLAGLAELKLPTGKISDIFEMAVEKEMLVVRPKLSGTDGQMRCTVEGIAGPCTAGIFVERNVPDAGIAALQFSHRDFSSDQEIFRHTMLFAHAGSVQLSMDLDGLVRSKSVSLIEDMKPDDPGSAVRLVAQLIDAATDESLGQYNLSAGTFGELRRKYPRETQEFVVPILRDLQQQAILAPDARVAAQVFQTQPKADAQLNKTIEDVLAKFDADSFQEREAAAKSLEALGQPAALVLMHADRKGWSLDRASGVDAFLAQFKAMPGDEIARLKKDSMFLLDCLYSDDAAIRAAASNALEKSTQSKIDPNATGIERDRIVDRAWAKLFPPLTTQPATQP